MNTEQELGRLTIGQAVRATEGTRALEGVWLAFTTNTSEEAARRRFRARCGHEPARMLHSLGLLLVGPVIEQTSDSLAYLVQSE